MYNYIQARFSRFENRTNTGPWPTETMRSESASATPILQRPTMEVLFSLLYYALVSMASTSSTVPTYN